MRHHGEAPTGPPAASAGTNVDELDLVDDRLGRFGAVRDVARGNVEPRVAGVLREVRALAGAKVAEHDDVMAKGDQTIDGVPADEPHTRR
jgi:hypothetical protein